MTANLALGQRAIFQLGAEFRSRLNGLYMATFFVGGAIGGEFRNIGSSVLACSEDCPTSKLRPPRPRFPIHRLYQFLVAKLQKDPFPLIPSPRLLIADVEAAADHRIGQHVGDRVTTQRAHDAVLRWLVERRFALHRIRGKLHEACSGKQVFLIFYPLLWCFTAGQYQIRSSRRIPAPS